MGEARPVGEAPRLELYSDGRIEDLGDMVLRGEVLDYYPEAEILFHADILEHVPAFRERGHGHWHKTVWRARLP